MSDKIEKVAEYLRGYKDGLESVMKEECKDVISNLCESITEAVKHIIPLVMQNLEIKADLDAARWIPVSERLPEHDAETLVAVRDENGYYVIVATFRKNGFWRMVEGEVTHWMPLPDPPAKDSDAR